jgi:hypothetical protein
MGWFDRKVPEIDESELAPQPQSQTQPKPQPKPQPQAQAAAAPAAAKPKPAARPEPEPAPAPAPAPRPATGFGIEKAIELMRTLPEANVALVVQVVRATLESANVSVEAIIGDADAKQDRIESRISVLEDEIKDREDQIAKRKQEIKELQDDHAETKAVRGKLELSLKPDDAPKKKAGPKPVSGPSTAASPLIPGPSTDSDDDDAAPKPAGRVAKASPLRAPSVPRPVGAPSAPKLGD